MKNSKQIIRFIIIGTLNALITVLVVWFMMDLLHIDYIYANIAGYSASLINNFFWSKFWVFNYGKGEYFSQSLLFLIAFACAYLSQFIILLIMVEILGWNQYISQFLGLFIYGYVNFMFNKKVTFSPKGNTFIHQFLIGRRSHI